MTKKPELTLIRPDLLVDSRTIATRLENQHASTMLLIQNNLAHFEGFGQVRFEIDTLQTAGGPQKTRFALLNEDQCCFLLSLSRNSETVVTLKASLVYSFKKVREAATLTFALPTTIAEALRLAADALERNQALEAAHAVLLLQPSPPMLFMGEEYAASTPFQYFCDFSGDLAAAVTRGRRAEFGRFARFSDPAVRDLIPDPCAESSFLRSKLDWRERTRAPHDETLALYTGLLAVRQRELMPWLAQAQSGSWTLPAPGSLRITWPLGAGCRWHLLAQLAGHAGPAALADTLPGRTVYRSHATHARLAAWSVQVAVEVP